MRALSGAPTSFRATTQMKLLLLVFFILVTACCLSWAADQDQRFVEFKAPGGKTRTYDLNTVQMIQPGYRIVAKCVAR